MRVVPLRDDVPQVEMPLLKGSALQNMVLMFLTWPVLHMGRGWLKEWAPLNMGSMVLAMEVPQ